jgi:hypothetical protein
MSLEQAERRHRQARALRSMTATLRALLEGKLSRADVETWTRTLWPENGGQGDDLVGDSDPLVALAPGIDALTAKTGGTTPVRYWLDGIGWYLEMRFAAPTTGRPFAAFTNAEGEEGPIAVHKRRDDPWRQALIDLFEALEIDERDTLGLRPDIDLDALPTWSLWRQDDNGNRFEMDRFHSYAKADAQQQMFTARKHKQLYWVEAGV